MSGAQITVARGDVGTLDDVTKAISHIKEPIGGVIQAAMGLDVGFPRSDSFNDLRKLKRYAGGPLYYNVTRVLAHWDNTQASRNVESAQRNQRPR